MSSGSLVINQTTPWTDPGSSWYGFKFSKSWSGADAPLRKKSPKIPIVIRRWSRKRGFYEKTIYVRDPNAPSGAGRGNRGEHAYTKAISDYKSSLVTFKPTGWTSTRTVASFNWCVDGSFTDHAAMLASCKLAAQSGMRAAAQGGADFNLGTTLGELNETLGMVGDTAVRLARVVRSLRKGAWRDAVDTLFRNNRVRPRKEHLLPREASKVRREASNYWLELQYGWLPLLSDVKSAAEAFADHVSQPSRFNAKFGHRTLENIRRVVDFGDLGTRVPVTGQKKVSVHYKVVFKHTPNAAAKLGLADPASVAWELVPFSFVVDWFLPVGNYLEAVGGSNGLDVESVVESVKAESEWVIPFTGPCFYLSFTRSIHSSMPRTPLPRLKPLRDAFSFRHCVNGLALLSQAFH